MSGLFSNKPRAIFKGQLNYLIICVPTYSLIFCYESYRTLTYDLPMKLLALCRVFMGLVELFWAWILEADEWRQEIFKSIFEIKGNDLNSEHFFNPFASDPLVQGQ